MSQIHAKSTLIRTAGPIALGGFPRPFSGMSAQPRPQGAYGVVTAVCDQNQIRDRVGVRSETS